MEQKVLVESVASYNSHRVAKNGNVNLMIEIDYSEQVNVVYLLQLQNCNIDIKVKKVNEDLMELGNFTLNNINIDQNGHTKIKLNSLSDYVELNNLNKLLADNKEKQVFNVYFSADVDTEEAEETPTDEWKEVEETKATEEIEEW